MKARPVVFMIYLLLMTLLISLGNWQLKRAEQKRQQLHQRQAALQLPAININDIEQPRLEVLENRRVNVRGRWDLKHQLLIDNQMHQGQVGYWVMTPLIITGRQQAVLVNRGWIAMNRDRRILPDVSSLPTGDVLVNGRVNHFPQVAYALEGADIPTDGWPAVVQLINPEILAKKLGYPLLDFQIEMEADEEHGLVRDWKISQKMPAEKHEAYAMQWFGLAVTLTILMLWMGFKKTDE
jgi:surfeit locus 1 family protein